MMNRTKTDIAIIDKSIEEFRKEQKQLLNLALSNKKLIETRDGLKAILQVMKGDINETD